MWTFNKHAIVTGNFVSAILSAWEAKSMSLFINLLHLFIFTMEDLIFLYEWSDILFTKICIFHSLPILTKEPFLYDPKICWKQFGYFQIFLSVLIYDYFEEDKFLGTFSVHAYKLTVFWFNLIKVLIILVTDLCISVSFHDWKKQFSNILLGGN